MELGHRKQNLDNEMIQNENKYRKKYIINILVSYETGEIYKVKLNMGQMKARCVLSNVCSYHVLNKC